MDWTTRRPVDTMEVGEIKQGCKQERTMKWLLLTDDPANRPATSVITTFTDVEQLTQLAVEKARVAHGYPTLVELTLVGVSTMAVVVGGERSFAAFVYEPRGPRFFSFHPSVVSQENSSPLLYMQFGSQSEVDSENTIASSLAWKGMQEYFDSSNQPRAIPWFGNTEHGPRRWEP